MSFTWGQAAQAPRRPELWLRLAKTCDERCLFCYDEATMDGTMVPFGVIHRGLRDGRAKGRVELNLTGGEPTMHPHFSKVVRLAKLLGYRKVLVTTNGRRFKSRAFADEAAAAGLDRATFSVHGHTADLNDRLTRAHGSFSDSIAGLRNARAAGIKVGVHVVVNRLNAPHAGEILRFFKGLGVERVNFISLVPVSAAWDNRRELYPTPEDGWSQPWELFARSDDPELRAVSAEMLVRHAEYVASTARTAGYAGMFDRLLRTGQPQPCRGEKCACCPLDSFCRDLEALRETGRLRARPPEAPCSGAGGETPAELRLEGADTASFSEFFLAGRLRAKGPACGGCRENASCPGAPVSAIARSGFPVPPAAWRAA